jgi:FkbM family methyltransferase
MNKVAANIVKGLVGRMHRNGGQQVGELSWLQKKIIKHQDDQVEKVHNFKNFSVRYKRPYEFLHTYNDLFEKELYRFKTDSAQPLIIDCGANIGLSVLYFKQLYPKAHILVFEPDENNFDLLSKNCIANGLKDVELYKEAVWIEDGFISFAAKQSEASHILESDEGLQVKSRRLTHLLQAHLKIHFLKMDIEGAEYKVVQDAASALHKVDNFFLEYHGKAEETGKLADIVTILKEAGFSVYIKSAADNLLFPFAQKSTGTLYDVQLNLFCYRNA